MVDGISDLFRFGKDGPGPEKKKAPDPGDVHAMAASMKETDSCRDLGALYSGRMKMVSREARAEKGKTGLEQRLARYQAQKEQAAQKIFGRPDQGERQGGGQGEDRENGRDREESEHLAREVAQQILSGGKVEGEGFGSNEVMIRVRDEILEGCHIHLILEKDCLRVKLAATDPRTLEILKNGRHTLAELLEKNYDGLIRLSFHRVGQSGLD